MKTINSVDYSLGSYFVFSAFWYIVDELCDPRKNLYVDLHYYLGFDSFKDCPTHFREEFELDLLGYNSTTQTITCSL